MTLTKPAMAVAIMLVTAFVNVAGVAAMYRYGSNAPLGLAAGLTGMVAFVGMLLLLQKPGGVWRVTESAMRTAITTAVLAQYLALVSMAAFAVRAADPLSPMSQLLLTNFTTIVGIVIAFYFGASAFVEGKRVAARGGRAAAGDQSRRSQQRVSVG